MITPLLKTNDCFFETFTELNALDIIIKLDFNGLTALQTVMDPIKLAVQVLSREDANLSTTDSVIFMLLK